MSFSDLIPFYPEWNFTWFLQINKGWANDFFDVIMPLARNKLFWLPFYVFITSFLLINLRKAGLYVLVVVLLSFAAANTMSAEIMKPTFKQDRPCNSEVFKEHVEVRVNCGPGKSFPSAHATNHFAIAVSLGVLLLGMGKWILLLGMLWAGLVSYAQVYVGVHYPVDVIAGALLGSVIGGGLALLFKRSIGKRILQAVKGDHNDSIEVERT